MTSVRLYVQMQMSMTGVSKCASARGRTEMVSVLVKAPDPRKGSILARAGHRMQIWAAGTHRRSFAGLNLGGREIEELRNLLERRIGHCYADRFDILHRTFAELTRWGGHGDQHNSRALPDVNSGDKHWRVVGHLFLGPVGCGARQRAAIPQSSIVAVPIQAKARPYGGYFAFYTKFFFGGKMVELELQALAVLVTLIDQPQFCLCARKNRCRKFS